jgi:hypothetical protein
LTQVVPPWQTVPQEPQLLLSLAVLMQPPLQAVGASAGQVAQTLVLFLTCLQ